MTLLATIEKAMQDRAPALHQQLKDEGKLTAYLRQTADEVKSSTATGMMEMRQRQGWDKLGLTLPQMAGRLAAARSSAMESALDAALQFPPQETSSPSPD